MKLILIRHGETEENAARIIQGQTGGKLSGKGKEQVQKLALRLKNEKIDLTFSSDLARSKDTTAEIIKYHQIPVYYDSLLRERCKGIFNGRPREEFSRALQESGLPFLDFTPEGGESFVELENRAKNFLNNLFENHNSENIMISSHGGFIRMLLGIILNKHFDKLVRLENTSISIVELDKNLNVKNYELNNFDHL